MPKYKLMFDLDCTVVDLPFIILQHYNHDFKDNKTKITKYNFGDLDKATYPYFEQLLHSKGLFYNAPPIKGAVETINKFLDEGYDCYFVSNPLHNKYCAFEKYQWIERYIPKFNEDNIIFAGDKSIVDSENRILIDDYVPHLKSWNKGVPICFSQPWNEEWDKIRVNSWNELYELIKILKAKE